MQNNPGGTCLISPVYGYFIVLLSQPLVSVALIVHEAYLGMLDQLGIKINGMA